MSLVFNSLAITNGALLAAAGISTARRTWDRSAEDRALQRAAYELAKTAFIASLAYEVRALRPLAIPGMPVAAFWSISIMIGAAGLGAGVAKRRSFRSHSAAANDGYPAAVQGN